MLTSASWASRSSRALTLAVLSALTACSDNANTTAPAVPSKPNFAFGDVITVTNTSGATDQGSLRWAVAQAVGGEIIRFDPSIAGKTIVVDAPVAITQSVTIEGPQDKGITIHGGNKVKVFAINTAGPTTLRNLTIAGGATSQGAGGAIESVGSGVTTVSHSTVTGNTSQGSVIFGNAFALINSTVTNNTTSADTRALYVVTLNAINSTISNNSSGGITTEGKTLLRNSIVANNGTGPNCERAAFPAATFVLEGANLADDNTCGDATAVIIAEPQLDSLEDNGSPTMTRKPLIGSPVIEAGKSCDLTDDQRYVQRDTKCDLGAVEFADFMAATLTIDGSATVAPATGATTVTGTAECSREGKLDVTVKLQQTQKAGRTPTTVQAEGVLSVDCTTSVRGWGLTLLTTSGSFTNGSATATVTPPSVDWLSASAASRDVRVFWGHK